MKKFLKLLTEQLLLEISLSDHYAKYVEPKYATLDFSQYEKLATSDPTTRNNQKGKYVDWLIKTFVDSKGMVKGTDLTEIKSTLEKFIKKPVDINQFKSFTELTSYIATLPETSKREEKKKVKDILNSPDDIRVIENSDKWIIIETLTRKGNIMGAQYKTNPQANWCTAYLDQDTYWKSYSRNQDLIQFISKKDPYEKYQIAVKDGRITESRDYDDRQSNKPREIIDNSEKFTDEYGEIEEEEPFKLILDESGVVEFYLDLDNFNDHDYLNRQPSEHEYDHYTDEAYSNVEYQINHWDRVISNGFDAYKNLTDSKYADKDQIEDRMNDFVSFIADPPTADDKKDAKEAVEYFFNEIDEEYEDFLKDSNPKDEEEEFDVAKEFQEENEVELEYAQFFIDSGHFDHKFAFEKMKKFDNSDQQMSFKFESFKRFLKRKLVKG